MAEPAHTDSADRRVRKTKMQLRLALCTLLSQKSIEEITVRELADLSDINRSTFYKHYRDIFDLLDQMENDLISKIADTYARHAVGIMTKSDFAPLLSDLFYLGAEYKDMQALLGKNGDPLFLGKVRKRIEDEVQDWFPMLAGREDTAHHIYLFEFLNMGSIGVLESWYQHGANEPPELLKEVCSQIVQNTIVDNGAKRSMR
jgi:AcrR family transcriptional regulator